MVSFDHQSYIPIAMAYDVVSFNNELVQLQEQRLGKRNTEMASRLPKENNSNGILIKTPKDHENVPNEPNKPLTGGLTKEGL